MNSVHDQALSSRVQDAWRVLHDVLDPEVPAISVTDLGIVRDVIAHDDGIEVIVTPTYSGCPATEVIAQSISDAIAAAGLGPARVTQRRAPAWTTDWITPEGREKLRAYGIAPPGSCASEATGANVSPIRLMATMNTPLAIALPMITCSHSGSVSKSGCSGSEPIAVG